MYTWITSLKSTHILPWVVALALFIEMLDSTLIVIAIPKLSNQLSVSPISLHIIIMSYLIGLIVILPFCRWIINRFGALQGFTYAISLFMLGTIICIISPSLWTLALGRGIQGVGAGLMGTLSRNVLIENIPSSQLLKVTGFIAIPVLLGPALGPIVGGFIVEHFHWRYLFIFNLPIGVILMIGASYCYPSERLSINQALDKKGALLLGSAFFAIGYLLYNPILISAPYNLLLLIFVACLLATYIQHSIQTHAPLLKLNLLQDRTFFLTMLTQVFLRLALAGFPLVVSLDLQVKHHQSPTLSGFALSFFALGMALARPLCAPTVNLLGVKFSLLLYGLLLPFVLFTFSIANLDAKFIEYCALIFICGSIISLQYGILHVLAFSEIPKDKMPEAVTLATVVQQLGTGIGIMITAKVLLFSNKIESPYPYSDSIKLLSVFAIFAFFTILFFKKNAGITLRNSSSCKNEA